MNYLVSNIGVTINRRDMPQWLSQVWRFPLHLCSCMMKESLKSCERVLCCPYDLEELMKFLCQCPATLFVDLS